MTKVAPIIRVLDKMYAGQIVMKQYCDAYGLDWAKWHPDVFQSVQRRHEALVADVQQALTLNIPEGAFFPLGIKSQILLTGEAAVVDPEALAQVQEHAIAKAEARFAEKRRQKELELVGEGARLPRLILQMTRCYSVWLKFEAARRFLQNNDIVLGESHAECCLPATNETVVVSP